MLISTSNTALSQFLALKAEYNALLLNVVERDCHDDVKIIGDSTRLRDIVSGCYMFSVSNWEDLELLMSDTKEKLNTFYINNSHYTERILERARKEFPQASAHVYQSFVLQNKGDILCPENREDVELTKLDLSWLPFILERYKNEEFGHERYVANRISKGPGLGLIYRGERVGFVLQHKDGETGPASVDSKFRGMGFGTYLMKQFNCLLTPHNSILLSLVKHDNFASAQMLVKSGYRLAEHNVVWVYHKLNNTLYLP